MKTGKLIVFCGPSGTGKGSIEAKILKISKYNFHFSISATSRKPRKNELDGVNYHFITKKEFKQKIRNKEFLEWAYFFKNYYGTLLQPVREMLDAGKNVFLEIETIGVKQILKKIPETITIFISPPSIETLEERLLTRNTENKKTIKKRIKKARKELKEKKFFKYVVINDNINRATSEVIDIFDKELNA